MTVAVPAHHPPAGPASPDLALGLDVGGTKLAAGLVDAGGRVLAFETAPTRPAGSPGDPTTVLDRLCLLARGVLAGVDPGRLCGVGIACCGPVNARTGLVYDPPNLPGWCDVPVAELVGRGLGLPAWVENDATAATMGEWRHGAGVGARDLVYLTISTGVGGGVVAGGALLRGGGGNGGEPGHVIVVPGGRRCGCGTLGCLEAYVSGTGIAARAAERLAAGEGSSLAGAPALGAAVVAAHAGAGDPLAAAVWRETTDLLGSAISGLVNVFEPELVILGGGVARTGEQLLGPVRERVRALALRPAGATVRIVRAALDDRVGVVGAAAVAHTRAAADRA